MIAQKTVSSSRAFRYYEILGIKRNDSQEEIKKKYRTLAFQYHPDKNPNKETQKKMLKINEAYSVLSKPDKRKAYDNSPVECPDCWTYLVAQSSIIEWRCRQCGCRFKLTVSKSPEVTKNSKESETRQKKQQAGNIKKKPQKAKSQSRYTTPHTKKKTELKKRCPRCGYDLPNHSVYCLRCGHYGTAKRGKNKKSQKVNLQSSYKSEREKTKKRHELETQRFIDRTRNIYLKEKMGRDTGRERRIKNKP